MATENIKIGNVKTLAVELEIIKKKLLKSVKFSVESSKAYNKSGEVGATKNKINLKNSKGIYSK